MHPAGDRMELNVVASITLLDTTLYIVKKDFAWRVGRYGLSEVLRKSIVGKLQAFFRAVRPQVSIHTTMNGFTVFTNTGAPGIVPHTTPVILFFVTLNFCNRISFLSVRFKCAEHSQTTRICPNNSNFKC